jgi:hypothetical protein
MSSRGIPIRYHAHSGRIAVAMSGPGKSSPLHWELAADYGRLTAQSEPIHRDEKQAGQRREWIVGVKIFDEMQVPAGSIRLGGGGARSQLWRQIQADVYGREVAVVEAEEGAAYGAAILAGVGARRWATVDEACDAVVRVATRITHRTPISPMPR